MTATDQQEMVEIRAFNRSFWVGGSSPATDRDIVALIKDHEYGCTDIAMMYGLSRERIRQIAVRNGLKTRGSLPRLWDAALSRFRAMTREEWRTRNRLQHKARMQQRLANRREPERRRHVEAAQRLAKELGRVPSLPEIALAIGKPVSHMIQYWGYSSCKVGEHTGRQATTNLYRAAGMQKRLPGQSGHIDGPNKRKLTPEQVRRVWESPHPYKTVGGFKVNYGVAWKILNRQIYRDITVGWPEPACRRTA